MKSYKRPYRVYYELWREDGEHKYKKTTGIPLDIAGYGRVMLRCEHGYIWNMTDYGTGLAIAHLTVPKSEDLYECAKKYILTVAIPKIMNSTKFKMTIWDARKEARQITLLRKYLDKEDYLMV